MSYLIVGVKGMLGRAVRELCQRLQRPYTGVDLPEFDLTDPAQVERAVTGGYKAVLNCAAYANVDGAEANEATANKINGYGVELLARTCALHAVPLVHYSTDYVFSGSASAPYPVDEPHAPLGAYGRSKALGERALWAAGGPHLLIRTSWLYAPWANNFVRTVFKLTRERPSIKMVSDQRGRPTSAEHLARATLQLLDLGARGNLHVTDGGECTWDEFAREIARLAGHTTCDVGSQTAAEYKLLKPDSAPRPAYSVLDLAPAEALLGPMPDWHTNVADVLARLEPV
jgi:dTDP-4-dehydrorhamnose reductase